MHSLLVFWRKLLKRRFCHNLLSGVKNRRTKYAGFFIFVSVALTLFGCGTQERKGIKISGATEVGRVREIHKVNETNKSQGSVNYHENKKIKINDTDCGVPGLSARHEVVKALDDSFARGKWNPQYDLERGAQVLLKIGNQLVLAGEFSAEFKTTYVDLFFDHNSSSFCVTHGRSPSVEYLFIDAPKNVVLTSRSTSYFFVYPNPSQRGYAVELDRLSYLAGKILVVQVSDASTENLRRIRQIIVHEGAHFFGQGHIIHLEPSPPDDQQSSRSYLEKLVLTDPEFKRSVQNEFCLAHQLLDVDRSLSNADRIAQSQEILIKMLDESDERGVLFDVFERESFWYFVEGIPQYLEHLVELEADELALEKQYGKLCRDPTEVDFSLYFLFLGSAVLHGLDLVSKEKSSEIDFLHMNSENVFNFRQRAWSFLINQ